MPKEKKPPLIINGEEWTYLGAGSFNHAYVNKDKTEVLKIAKPSDTPEKTDTPERSVRLWNEINPTPPFAKEIKMEDGKKAWTCPFIAGTQPTPEELSKAVIDVFNRTGRIVVDAIVKDNFLKTKDGRIFCVDIGFALDLAFEETKALAKIDDLLSDKASLPVPELATESEIIKSSTKESKKRRGSIVSAEAWETYDRIYSGSRNGRKGWLDQMEETEANKIPVQTVKALLFIKRYCPEITDANFLIVDGKVNKKLISKLAEAYSADYNAYSLPEKKINALVELKTLREEKTIKPTQDKTIKETKEIAQEQLSKHEDKYEETAGFITATEEKPKSEKIAGTSLFKETEAKNTSKDIIQETVEIVSSLGKKDYNEDLNKFKTFINGTLTEYINSRAVSNTDLNKVTLRWTFSSFFRNSNQVKKNVALARELIKNINDADSFTKIITLLDDTKNSSIFKTRTVFNSKLKEKLLNLLVIADKAVEKHPTHEPNHFSSKIK